MNDCIFCKIISHEIPSLTVYEDDTTYAFLDIRPVNYGHTLVVPKNHYRNIFDIPESDWLAVMKTVRMLAPAVRNATRAEGVNIHSNNEPASGQSVFHAHAHIIPRYLEDGHKLWAQREYQEGESQSMAFQIQSALKEMGSTK